MNLKHWLAGATGALALGILVAPAEAATLGGAAENLKATVNETAAMRHVTWDRRRYYRPYYYGPGYYYGPRYRRDGPRDRFHRYHWRERHQHGG